MSEETKPQEEPVTGGPVAGLLNRPITRRGLLRLFGIGAASGAAAAAVPSFLLGRVARADPAATELQLSDDVITLKPRTVDPALIPASLWFVDPDWRTTVDGATVTSLELRSKKGVANGYASLDGSTLLPLGQLPNHDIITKHNGFPGGSANFLREDGTWQSPPTAVHNILSASHGDTTAASVARGDIMYGDSTPKWTRKAIGGSGQVLHSDGVDVAWAQLGHSELGGVTVDQHHAKVHADAEHSLVYEKQSNKGIASGYASLDASVLVPTAQLGTGAANAATFLRGDQTWGAPTASPHTILSATHSDTTAASVVRGDVLAGVGASPKWERIAIGSSGKVLRSDGTDVAWTQLAHTDLASVTADQHHAQLHKAAHVSGGGDAFVKGDVLIAAPRYLEAVSDPASDSQRAWMNVGRVKFWSNEGTPVKHSVANLDDDLSAFSGTIFATPAIVLGTAAAAGSATTTIRSDSTIVAFDATVPTTSAMGDAAAVGSAAVAARRDHRHGRESFATNTILLGSSAVAGSATTPFRSDDTIAAFDATVPTTSAVGDAAAVGSIAFAARRDHRHGREAFATNAVLLGSAAAAGSATTLMRRDDTIAAFDTTAVAAVTPDAAATVGVINFASRRDHQHGMATSASAPIIVDTTAAAAGTSGHAPSRDDHRHQLSVATNAILLGTAAAAGAAATTLRSNDTIAAFDATVPTTSAVGDAAATGSIAFAARRDHVHGREAFATPVKVTPAALSAAGTATTVVRSDHAHQAPGGVARNIANVAIANTETAVITWTPGANFLIAGTTVRITGMGILTSGGTPGTCTLNVRCGTNATTGTVASTTTVDTGTSQTNIGFWFEAILTVRTTGAGGTCYAQITFLSNIGSTTKVRNSGTTATAVVDTTSASTIISLSMISGNAGTTYTWNVAAIEVIHMG